MVIFYNTNQTTMKRFSTAMPLLAITVAITSDAQSPDQVVRRVMHKEQHARQIIDTVCDYFLTQRVTPGQQNYAKRLTAHHARIVAGMQAKQYADVPYANTLKERIAVLLS